jgi:2-dehydro-3-deoxyphosphogluconate aldolase/(4S)-4-hydroxy-2-oxoglutarate aldolase
MRAQETLAQVKKSKIIAIVRDLPLESMAGLAHALVAGGIDLMEVTFRQGEPDTWQETAEAIQRIDHAMQGKVLVGAGTVMNAQQLRMAHDAGAQYIITPNVNVDLIRQVKAYGLASFPGALTPSEIAIAQEAGADAVKVFPAASLGASYIKAIRAPLSAVPLMAVGGVNENNAAEFIAAGCVGIGVGGNLVNKQWIAAGEWGRITALAQAYRRIVATN